MKQACAILLLFALGGCSAAELPLAKEQPVAEAPTSLVKPPWEALVNAGPDAAKDIDYETLDGPGLRPTLDANGQPVAAAPDSATAPAQQAAVHDDGAIRNVYVAPVSGGDATGTAALTEAMRQQLGEAGWPVLNAARKDALTIAGKLTVSGPQTGARTVAIDWTVKTPAGKVLGVISQKNTIPEASLGKGWRQTAEAAAGAAADGIFQLVGKVQAASQ